MDWYSETSEPQLDQVAIGVRVRAARERLGVKQQPFSATVGLSQSSLSRLETGQLPPESFTSEVLSRLAGALGRSMNYLLAGSPVRDRVRLAARGDDGEDIASRCERLLDLLEVDADLDELDLIDGGAPAATPPWVTFAQAELESARSPSKEHGAEFAARVRDELGLGSGPLVDLNEVVEEKLGIDLAVVRLGAGLSGAAAFDDVRHVVIAGVNVDEPYERQRYSLAHEVAHVLFGDEHSETARRSPAEMRADKFAQTLLIPAGGIRAWIADQGLSQAEAPFDYTSACRLAETFGVSPMVVWIALDDLNLRPAEEAPTAKQAAITTGHLTEHIQRKQAARVERVPRRIEARVLAALRRGYLNEVAAAAALGQDPSELLPDALPLENKVVTDHAMA